MRYSLRVTVTIHILQASVGRVSPRKAYRIVEELPSESEDSEYTDSSDEEWLLFDLSGSTKGSGDYSLWPQLLHELY